LQAGLFITFEGGEGAGKSTQIRLLADRLRLRGAEVVSTREPGGSPLAEKLREVILSGQAREFGPFGEALLFSAARIDHIDTLIKPALARGAFVLCDRFYDSTRAYQGALGKLDPGLLQALEAVTLAGLKPDLTLMLDLPAEQGLERARARRGQEAVDRFEGEDLSFHEGLRQAFKSIAKAEPNRCALIDASPEPEIVAAAIWRVVEERFFTGGKRLKKWA
jgi:dTMP kinase